MPPTLTIHTTDAAKTVGRLLAMFPASDQMAARMRLSENLAGTISQRLLPRADNRGRVVWFLPVEAEVDPALGKLILERLASRHGRQAA